MVRPIPVLWVCITFIVLSGQVYGADDSHPGVQERYAMAQAMRKMLADDFKLAVSEQDIFTIGRVLDETRYPRVNRLGAELWATIYNSRVSSGFVRFKFSGIFEEVVPYRNGYTGFLVSDAVNLNEDIRCFVFDNTSYLENFRMITIYATVYYSDNTRGAAMPYICIVDFIRLE